MPFFRGDGVGFSFVSSDGDVRRGSVFCGQDGVCFLTNLWNRVGCLSHRLWWFTSPSGFLLFGEPGSLSEASDSLVSAM